MATLEKIRSKSVLLVSIIFVALFLFIITIIDNPLSLFMDQTTVLNVNGQKIENDEYQTRISNIREANPEATDMEATAVQSLITETLMKQEFNKLGITVTPDEISGLLSGENANPYIVQSFAQNIGATPDVVLAAIQDPAQYNLQQDQVDVLHRQVVNFEDNLESQLASQKLMNLIIGTINANKLDAKALFDEGNTTYTLATVSRSVFENPDTITPAELEQFYKEHRERYNIRESFGLQEPKRYVRYVTLDIAPSASDRQKAAALANETLAMIEASQGMDTLMGNSAFLVDHKTVNAAGVRSANIAGLQEFLDTAAPGQVKILNLNSIYSPNDPKAVIARLVSRQNQSNSAQLVGIALDGTIGADTIAAQLNAGIPADSIKGIAQIAAQPETFQFTSNPALADTIKALGVGKYFPYNGMIISIGTIAEPELTYDFYTATYNIEPSRETIENLNTRMRDFLVKAPTAADFVAENATEQGLMVQDAIVGASDNSINGLDDTQSLIAWALHADKGNVSRLYTNSKNTRLTALAVVDEYKDYITTSFPGLHDGLSAEAQQDKTSKRIIAEFAGKGNSLADYQKAMGVSRIDTMRGINFSNGRYGTLSSARGHKKGDVVGPLRWNSAVVVYSIVDETVGTMPYDEAASANQFRTAAQRSIIGQDLVGLLLGNGKIENRIWKFTRQD